jgi:hypothetical protein
VKEKLVSATSREFGAGPGARENVVTATEKALALLSSKKKIALFWFMGGVSFPF